MIEVNKQGEVWVFAEHKDGHLHEVALELLSKGRELADQLETDLSAVLLGYQVEGFAPQLLQENFTLAFARVSDRTDGKLVHLDGLNFSRAWVISL